MRILVTGANGFLGKNLLERLAKEGAHDVVTLTSKNSTELSSLVRDVDFVFHFAAVMRPKDERDFQTVNVDLTKRILNELSQSKKHPRILFTSSVQAELDNPYGHSKKAAEEAIFTWSADSGNKAYVYRLPNVFGKWSEPNYSSVVATFTYNISHNLPIQINDPERVITLAYVDDVMDAFMINLEDEGAVSSDKFYYIQKTTDISLINLADTIKSFKHPIGASSSPFPSGLLTTYNYFNSLP